MNDLHSENVPTTNWSESPKYAAFELFFKSQGKKEGMKVCKHMPKTTNCSDKGLLTLESLQQKLYSAQERRKKCIERKVTKARSRQLSTQKFSNVGVKRKQDGKSKRNQSEVSDSCRFEKKEIIASSTHINTTLDERNECKSSVAFEVPFGPPGSYTKTIPRRLCKQKRTSVSIEGIKEKQHMAEVRKKELEEARLKRIKDRQESARKLAENVEILLQQRSLASGQHDGHVQLMNMKQVMKTAQQVAQQFKSLSGQMTHDLAVEWKYKSKHGSKTKTRSKDQDCNENTIEKPSQVTNKIPRSTSNGVAFSIDIYPDKCTNSQTPKKLTNPQKARKKDILTAEDVEEKLIKAEERRIRRREEKVKKVIANREALLRLSSNIEMFLNEQEKSNSRKLSRQEVANLANEIANGFDRLSERYRNDLKRAENFPTMNLYCLP